MSLTLLWIYFVSFYSIFVCYSRLIVIVVVLVFLYPYTWMYINFGANFSLLLPVRRGSHIEFSSTTESNYTLNSSTELPAVRRFESTYDGVRDWNCTIFFSIVVLVAMCHVFSASHRSQSVRSVLILNTYAIYLLFLLLFHSTFSLLFQFLHNEAAVSQPYFQFHTNNTYVHWNTHTTVQALHVQSESTDTCNFRLLYVCVVYIESKTQIIRIKFTALFCNFRRYVLR